MQLPVVRFPVVVAEDHGSGTNVRNAIAVSPDGTQIVYVANSRLYKRSLADFEAREIPGTETRGIISSPVFSLNGRSIAFWADGAIKRIAVSGGSAVTICQAGNPWGMSWDEPGIVFGRGPQGILQVAASGGKPDVVAAPKAGEIASQPQLLPGGNAVIFTLTTGQWDKAQIVVQNLKSGTRTVPIEGGSAARYVPTGHIVYAVGGTLLAVSFDLNRLQVSGPPVSVVEGVMRSDFIGTAYFSFSGTGTLAYRADPGPMPSSLVLVDGKGVVEPVKLPPGPYGYPRVSRDGKRLTYGTDGGNDAAVWIYDLSGSNAPQQLTFQGVPMSLRLAAGLTEGDENRR